MIATMRSYQRHYLSFDARILVIVSNVWSQAWYLHDIRPLDEDSLRMRYLQAAT